MDEGGEEEGRREVGQGKVGRQEEEKGEPKN